MLSTPQFKHSDGAWELAMSESVHLQPNTKLAYAAGSPGLNPKESKPQTKPNEAFQAF